MADEKESYPQGAEEDEYKGKPLLVLNPSNQFAFKFGLSKAKMILDHLDDIKEFVEKYDDGSDE